MNTIQRVNELATERNLSLYRLSIICDVPYATLKNAETRNSQLSIETIERICHGLSITMSDFFTKWVV